MSKTDEKIKKIFENFRNEALNGKAAQRRQSWFSLMCYVRFFIMKKIRIGEDIKNLGLNDGDVLRIIGPCPSEESKVNSINTLKDLLEKTRRQLQSGELRYSDGTLTVELPESSVNALTNELQKIENVLPSIVNFTNKDCEFLEEAIENIMKALYEIAGFFEEQTTEKKFNLAVCVMFAEEKNKKLVVSGSGEVRFE